MCVRALTHAGRTSSESTRMLRASTDLSPPPYYSMALPKSSSQAVFAVADAVHASCGKAVYAQRWWQSLHIKWTCGRCPPHVGTTHQQRAVVDVALLLQGGCVCDALDGVGKAQESQQALHHPAQVALRADMVPSTWASEGKFLQAEAVLSGGRSTPPGTHCPACRFNSDGVRSIDIVGARHAKQTRWPHRYAAGVLLVKPLLEVPQALAPELVAGLAEEGREGALVDALDAWVPAFAKHLPYIIVLQVLNGAHLELQQRALRQWRKGMAGNIYLAKIQMCASKAVCKQAGNKV
eukprot:1156027-Pelagomonas_calceolata.AAC.6